MLPLLLMSLGACVIPKSVGENLDDGVVQDGDGTSTQGVTETGVTETGVSETTTPGDAETGMALQCPQIPEFQCSTPPTCLEGCGGPFSSFDEDGCLRPSCGGSDDCDAGQTCLFPQDYGGCASSGTFCSDGPDGECQCSSDPDCGGGYCLPDDEVPPLDCFGLPDEPSCVDANCSEFHSVLQISDTCECLPDLPACLLFLGGIGGSASPDFFWHEASGTVAMFGTSWAEPPVGWRPCSDPGAPPACDCYEPFMEPACP